MTWSTGTAAATPGNGTDVEIVLPSGIAADDKLVLHVLVRSGQTFTIDTGDWNYIGFVDSDGGFGLFTAGVIYVYDHDYDGVTSPELTLGNSGGNILMAQCSYVRHSGGLPTVDTSVTAFNNGNVQVVTSPSATAAEDDSFVMHMLSVGNDLTTVTIDSTASSNLASHTILYDEESSLGVDGTTTAVVGPLTTAGSTGTVDLDLGTANRTAWLTLVLSPPASGSTDTLTANDVESASEVTSPSVGQTHAITANDVSSTSEVSSPALGQIHSLTAASVESASEVSAPAVTESNILLANDVEAASEVTAPAIGQVHALVASDVESASEVTAPAVGQVHALAATSVESASEVSAPVLASGSHSLLADDVEAASEVSAPTMAQVHVLSAANIEAASEVSQPVINRATQQRGDDAPGMFYGAGQSRRFFYEKQIRELEDVAEEIATKPIPAQKARKRLKAVIDPLATTPQPVQSVDLLQRVLAAVPAKDDGQAERDAFLAAVAAYTEAVQRQQKRRRENDALALLLMVA